MTRSLRDPDVRWTLFYFLVALAIGIIAMVQDIRTLRPTHTHVLPRP